MSVLVESLKKDHNAIFETLEKIRALGVNSKEGQQELIRAKESLVTHLKKEDERLYPALKRSAETNKDLKRTLEMFAADMDGISKNAIQFINKYSNGGSGLEFAKDFGKLFATLKMRMQKEEDVLYRQYDACEAQAA